MRSSLYFKFIFDVMGHFIGCFDKTKHMGAVSDILMLRLSVTQPVEEPLIFVLRTVAYESNILTMGYTLKITCISFVLCACTCGHF